MTTEPRTVLADVVLRTKRSHSRQTVRTIVVAAAVVAVASAALNRPEPSPPIGVAPVLPPADDPGRVRAEDRLLARVGSVDVTEGDLRRYNEVARLSGRIIVRGQDLEELVSRTLLCLEANSRAIELSPAELAQALRRRRLLAASATATKTSAAELAEEARLDALAEKVRRSLVDDKLVIGKRDVDAALRAAGRRRSQKDPRAREELAHALGIERGRKLMPDLIAELRQRWHVEMSSDVMHGGPNHAARE